MMLGAPNPWEQTGTAIGWAVYALVMIVLIVLALVFVAVLIIVAVSIGQELRKAIRERRRPKLAGVVPLRREGADGGKVILPTGPTPPGGAAQPRDKRFRK